MIQIDTIASATGLMEGRIGGPTAIYGNDEQLSSDPIIARHQLGLSRTLH
jgi:hypothetical protein